MSVRRSCVLGIRLVLALVVMMTASSSAQAPVTVTVTADRTSVRVGDVLRLGVTVNYSIAAPNPGVQIIDQGTTPATVYAPQPLASGGLTSRLVLPAVGPAPTHHFVANFIPDLGQPSVMNGSGAVDVIVRLVKGPLYMWGFGGGDIGNGTVTAQNPLPIANGLTNVIAVASGERYTLALKADGTLWSWGNSAGQFGAGLGGTQTTVPLQVATDLAGNPFTGIVAMAAGTNHALAVKYDGGQYTLWSWGFNDRGELGDGTIGVNKLRPIQVRDTFGVPVSGVVSVAAGLDHSLALKWDGSVWAWGFNGSGQIGDGVFVVHTGATRLTAIPDGTVTRIAAGLNHSLALNTSGEVLAWGNNGLCQLGTGCLPNAALPVVAQLVPKPAVAIAAGDRHSVALLPDGTVRTWGANDLGQMGIGTFSSTASPTVNTLQSSAGILDHVIAIAAGKDNTLALTDDASVWTTGFNVYGQIGDGTVNTSAPTGKAFATKAITSAKFAMLGAPSKSITMSAIGANLPVATGENYTTNQDVPLTVNAPGVLGNDTDADGDALTAVLVSGPTSGSLTLNPDGSFTYTPATGFFGPATFTYRANDGALGSNVVTVTIAVAGVNHNPTAVNDTASVYVNDTVAIPVLANDSDVDGDALLVTVASQPAHGSAVANANGTISYTPVAAYAGSDSFTYTIADGRGGIATATVAVTVQPPTPVSVTVTADRLAARVGQLVRLTASVTAAGTPTGSIQFSDLSTTPVTTYPLQALTNGSASRLVIPWSEGVHHFVASFIPSTTSFASGSGSLDVTMQLLKGPLYMWGFDGGDAGTGVQNPPRETLVPTATTLTNVVTLSGGDRFTLALKSDGTVWSWGSSFGTSGLGAGPLSNSACVAADVGTGILCREDGTRSTMPHQITITQDGAPFTGVIAIAAGSNHGLAITADGSVWGWGPNNRGQLGDGTYDPSPGTGHPGVDTTRPVRVRTATGFATGFVSVAAGGDHSIALAADGTLWAWGFNGSGQTGTGGSRGVATPITVAGDPQFKKIAAGWNHNLALDVTGRVFGWGLNNVCQLGIDAISSCTQFYLTPTLAQTVPVGVVDIAAGQWHGAALMPDGTVRAWGGNAFGQIGNGSATYHDDPTGPGSLSGPPTAINQVRASTDPTLATSFPLDHVIAISAGRYHTLSLRDDGSIWTTGHNFDGQIGNNTRNEAFPKGLGYAFKATAPMPFAAFGTVSHSHTMGAISTNPPAAGADSYSTDEDTPLTVNAANGVLHNDSDAEGDSITAFLVNAPAANQGTVALSVDGSFTFTPAANFHGTASFTYKATDGGLSSAATTVTITVNSVEDTPVAVNDAFTTAEDTALTVNAPGVLSNDTDGDLDALTAVRVAGPSHGTLTLNGNGSFTYTPAANYNGPDSFTYVANDGDEDSNVATVSLTVTAVNDAPVAASNAYATDEDTTLSVASPGVLGNDSDIDNDPLTAVLVSSTSHGTLTLNTNGSFSYTPAANYHGPDSFTYKANDGAADSNVVTVAITVLSVNDAPVAAVDVYNTDEDTALTVGTPGLLANDSDVDGDTVTAVLVAGPDPESGTLTLNANGSFTFTPAANFNGLATFAYKANDGTLDSAPVTVAITVNAINDAPVAASDSYVTNEDTPLVVAAVSGVLINDTDIDGDALTALRVAGPSHGTLTLNGDGSFSYAPSLNFNGADSFTYQAKDASANSNIVTVSITVNPVNDAPFGANDSFSTNEDTVLTVAAGVLENDTDVDLDALTAAVVALPTHGALAFNPDGSFTYTPNVNFNGIDYFTYAANDGVANSITATVTLTVNAVNDAPTASDNAYATPEDTVLNVVAPGVLANDNDLDGDPLTAVLVADVTHGTLTLNGDGSFSYTPAANYNGPDSFTYRATDGTLQSSVVTVTLTISAVNDAPTAVNDAFSTDEDVTLGLASADLLGNDHDVEGDALTVVIVDSPSHGTLTPGAGGSLTYAPALNFNGSDSFTYRASDGAASSSVATVTLTVNAVNDAPVASSESFSTNEDEALTVAASGILANDSDVDSSTLTTVLVDGPAIGAGTLALDSNGSFTFTPTLNFNGTATFTYKVTDGALQSNLATATITVNPVNDAPVAGSNSYSTNEDTPLTVGNPGVLGNDSDLDSATLTAVLVDGPAAETGTLTLNPNGSFTFTPAANFNGTASFTYKANDGALDSNVATVTITVNAVNDNPIANADAATVDEDSGANAIDVRANDSIAPDIGETLSVTSVTQGSHGSVTFTATGVSYTPAANYFGSDSFTYTIGDGNGGTATATVNVTVTNVNDNPVATNDTATVDEDSSANAIDVRANDSIAPDIAETLSVTSVTQGSHGSVTFTATGVSYTPAANYFGSDSFTYTIGDGNGGTATATVNVTVTNVNDNPVANDDTATVDEDSGATTLDVRANDSIAPDIGETLSVTAVTQGANGTVVITGGGAGVSYTPSANFFGSDSFTYTIGDGHGGTATATVNVIVNAVNDAPTISDTADKTTNEDVASGPHTVTVGDVETAAASLVVTASSSNTTLVPNGNINIGGSGASRTVTLTPALNQNGTTTITVTVNDGTTTTNDTFVLTVNAVNDAPTISDTTDKSTNEDVVSGPHTVTVGDVETAAASLVVTATSSNTTLVPNGSISIGGSGASRTVTLTPALNQNGTTTITVTVDDGTITTNDTFVLTVNAVNDAPTISDTTDKTTNEDVASGPHTVTVGDVETAAASLVVTASSSNTTLVPNGNISVGGSGASRTVTLTPALNQNGTTTITVTVNDGTTTTNDTFVLTVTALNDAPSFMKGGNQTVAEDAAAQSVTAWATAISPGPANEASQAVNFIVSNDNNPLFSVQPSVAANGTLTYTPAANANGSATVTIQIHDDGGIVGGGVDTSVAQTFTITVTAVNDLPTISDTTDKSTNEDVASGPHTVTVGDVETAAASLIVTASSSNTTLVPNGNINVGGSGGSRTVTLTPALNQSGTTTITVTVDDGTATTNDTFVLTVNAVNDVPTISDTTDKSTNEDVASGPHTVTVGDVETAAASLVVTASSSNTTLVPNGNISVGGSGGSRTVTLTPALNQSGTTTITVTVDDGTTTTNDTFVLTVNAVNDAPTISDTTDKSTNEDAASGPHTVTVSDVETAAASLVVTASSSNTTLVPNGNISVGGSGGSRTVTLTPALNQTGTTTITVTVDDGTTTTNDTFVLTVTALNDAPSFTKGADQSVAEDAVAQSVAAWATSLSAGPGNESSQALNFIVSNNNNPLFSVQPAVAANGTLTYTLAANANGSATVTVQIHDDGGTTGGGVDTSAAQTFTIAVSAVNDAPSFTKGANQTVNEDAGAQSAAGWATALSSGPGNESTQVLNFIVSNNNNPLFSVQPAVAANGTLTYTPAANANGSATVTVQIHDDGGATGGGVDTSAAQTFTITVNAVNDLPTISNIVDLSTPESIAVTPPNFTVGDVETAAGSLTLTGSSTNLTLVPLANIVFGGSGASRTVTVTPVAGQTGTATITVTATDANSGAAGDSFVLTVTARTATSTAQPTTSLTPSTYGASVTFTATTSGTGGTPSGTMTFYDNGSALGTSTLNASGTASLATNLVAVGTRSITAVYNGNSQFAASTSPARTQTVNLATATAVLTVAPTSQQYTDNETFEVTVSSANGVAPAAGVNFKIGTQTMNTSGPVPFVAQGGGVWKATLNQKLMETVANQLAPGSKTVTTTYASVSPNYSLANPTAKILTMTREDARVEWTAVSATTGCPTCTTTVPLITTIKDISITADAAGDVGPGEIGKATVSFVNRANGQTLGTGTLTIVDTNTATATFNWTAVANGTYNVGVVVNGYYTRNLAADDRTVTVTP